MITTLVLFLVGFYLLIKGADVLVDGSVALAKRYGISNLVIGLTIVGFGTSAPELVVNLMSAIQGTTDLAIGNIVGSNIANVFLILGICAAIYPLSVQRNTVFKEIPLSLLAAVTTVVLASDTVIDGMKGAPINILTRTDGIVLLFFFVIFMYYIVGIATSNTDQGQEIETKSLTLSATFLYIVGGLGALVLGGNWIVQGAVFLAKSFGISESIIGLTIVAVGTSLPELATSVSATLKRQSDIAVGNIVGSNIFNIFWILGLSAYISPLPLHKDASIDFLFLIASSFVLFLIMFIGKRHTIDRWQGWMFIGVYVCYIVSFFLR